jgi:hypothetical protein
VVCQTGVEKKETFALQFRGHTGKYGYASLDGFEGATNQEFLFCSLFFPQHILSS